MIGSATPVEFVRSNRERYVAELCEWIACPSVSADPARHPRWPSLHATRVARPRLRQRLRGGAEPIAARRGPPLLLPVHRPRQPYLEPHLPTDRLSARLRRR